MSDKSTQHHSSTDYVTIRQQLLDADMLVTNIQVSELSNKPSDAEIERILPIQLNETTLSWAELLDEDRGTY